MEFNNKIGTLNTYDLITKFLNRPNITNHISKHLSSATMKPVDAVFSSVINDSFIILKFQENPKSSQYFKYLPYSDTYDRLDISSSKSIVDIGYNNTCFYYILSIGNTFYIITPNNEINYETLILKDSIKLSNEIGKKYIIKISCGENHCLFLTHAGMIYTLGDNTYGQLGLGENHITKENKEGILLKDLLNYRINDICAGKNHSFCFGVVRELTKAGNSGPNNNIEFDPKRPYYLFGWGDNSFYQLGIKQNNSLNIILKPTKISCNNNLHNPAIIGEELINISCGLDFSALLFKNGKLLTFGDNKYNQLIYKENEIMPNFTNNYLPKKIGKIIKIITGGNSLMLMSEFNKLIIFGKYNEPNFDSVIIVDLNNNCENYKYIFNDNILKVIVFNNEVPNSEVIKNINNIKINEFLVNLPTKENQNKNEDFPGDNIKNNTKLNNNNINNNNVSKNDETNNTIKNNNQKNKNVINNKDINSKTLDNNSNKKHLKLHSTYSNSSLKNNSLLEQKKAIIKNVNNINKKPRIIKYKNSLTKISTIANDKVIMTDTLSKYQNSNSKTKLENKNRFNGAEKKLDNSKPIKTLESNGKSNKSSQKESNENSVDLKLNEDNNTKIEIEKEKEKENTNIKINGNENENGNTNKNIIVNNQLNLDQKTFLNKNILKNKVPNIQNRYEDSYDSFNIKEKDKDKVDNILISNNVEQKKEKTMVQNINIEQKQNNGGNAKNGQNKETKFKPIILDEILNKDLNNKFKENKVENPQLAINEKNNNLNINNNIYKNNENKNTNVQTNKNNYNINNSNNNQKIDNFNLIDKSNKLTSNNNLTNNDKQKKNIDNNISNNSLNNINNLYNNKNDFANITNEIKLQNIDNNSKTFKNTNIMMNQNQEIKINENIKKVNNDILKNGINANNNNINQINNNKDNNKNILTSKKIDNNNNQQNSQNLSRENNSNKSNIIIKDIKISEKISKSYLPIKINNIEKKDESQNKSPEKKENNNIFRDLGQFVSSTMNKINKYAQNRNDSKKDSFFENIISGNFSNLKNINPKILLNNIRSGVPNRYRGRLWLKCIGNQLSITPDYFNINLSKYYQKYEDTKEIKYKLPFPYLGIFKENSPLTSDLCEVINGFVISRPDIKYNEKISYLVGMLLINMDKYQAYVSFMNLILNPNIIIYYLTPSKDEPIKEYGYSNTPSGDEDNNLIKNKKIPSIVEKNLRRVIFKQLLFHNLPDLCSNLELINVLPEDYFDEWNETIFCKNFNIDISMKIWDLFVVQGEKIIFDAGIAIMKELEEELNNCEEKEEALDILLNSQLKEINENNIINNMQKVEYPDWIQSEVLNMTEDTVIPVNFN